MEKKKKKKSPIYYIEHNNRCCNCITNILLIILIAVFVAFMIGSESMKDNTLEMLHLTRDMRNQTHHLGEFIQGAIPDREMNHIIKFAYFLVTDNRTLQDWKGAYRAIQSAFEQYENIVEEMESPRVRALVEESFTTISLINSAVPPLWEDIQNITKGAEKIVEKLSHMHEVDLKF